MTTALLYVHFKEVLTEKDSFTSIGVIHTELERLKETRHQRLTNKHSSSKLKHLGLLV